MIKISHNQRLVDSISSNSLLCSITIDDLVNDFEEISMEFHKHFSEPEKSNQKQNAAYHKKRYLDILAHSWIGKIVDIGNDKPFLSFFLDRFNPLAEFYTVSFRINESIVDLYEVDIEIESLPFESHTFDGALCLEVIEHLWRDPSYAVYEISRVLKTGSCLIVSTPNPCERHAITCALWGANPNQRSHYYAALESGHIHLWTVNDLSTLLDAHGFELVNCTTQDYYGNSQDVPEIDELIQKVSPNPHLHGDTIVIRAEKRVDITKPCYPNSIFADQKPVQFSGTIEAFALSNGFSKAER